MWMWMCHLCPLNDMTPGRCQRLQKVKRHPAHRLFRPLLPPSPEACSIHYAHAYARIMRTDICAHTYIKFVSLFISLYLLLLSF